MTLEYLNDLMKNTDDPQTLGEDTKVNMLESAVLRGTAQDVKNVIEFCGVFEFTARALGLACGCADLETVKVLVEAGYTFDYTYTKHLQEFYAVRHIYYEYDGGGIYSKKDALFWFLIVSRDFSDNIKLGDMRRIDISDWEGSPEKTRAEITAYLADKGVLTQNMCNTLYYYSILFGLPLITEVLEERGAILGDDVIYELTHATRSELRKEFIGLIEGRKNVILKFVELTAKANQRLAVTAVFPIDDFYTDRASMEKLFEYADMSAIGKKQFLINAIDFNAVDVFAFLLEKGYAKLPKTREAVLEYAVKKGRTEIAALIIEYKNTKVDLRKEEENKEKREMREFLADVNSASFLNKIWSTKKLDDGTLIVTSYKGSADTVTLPMRIGKFVVTAIGEYTFSPQGKRINSSQKESRKALKSIIIPYGITKIGAYAFSGCSCLENVTLPNSVTEINEEAFEKCNSLVNITIPEAITVIPKNCFCSCGKIENVVFPQGLKEICTGAFYKSGELKNIVLPDSVEKVGRYAFDNYRDIIYNQSKTVLWHYPEVFTQKSYTVAETVTKIADSAFMSLCGCEHLESVDMSDNVTEIGNFAFERCRSLSEIRFSKRLKKIGIDAFSDCALKTVVVPDSVTEIGSYAFFGCDKMKLIKLPKNLTKLEANIFHGCSELEALEIPDTVTEIGERAFANCRKLKEITVPKNVEIVPKYAFYDCSELKRITFINGKTKVYKDTFYRCTDFTIFAPKGSSVEKFAKRNKFAFEAL